MPVALPFADRAFGERFLPLEQHVEFGLEPIAETVASLKRLGADHVAVYAAATSNRKIAAIAASVSAPRAEKRDRVGSSRGAR